MTYTLRRYHSYQEYLDDDQLHHECNYRLLDTGEIIEVAEESELNIWIASSLVLVIQDILGRRSLLRIRIGKKELQVRPVGDRWVNRKPDVMVMQPEHLQNLVQAIKFGQVPPLFVAEVVSPGSESSDSYLRDYVWKRQQYEEWQIPEYWIIDPHREKITVLTLVDEQYQEKVYQNLDQMVSVVFPTLQLTPTQLFTGDV